MRILTVVTGTYGRRITSNIQQSSVPEWVVDSLELPVVLPQVIDYPEDYLPESLSPADLVLSLGEHPGVAELLPDIVQMCGARAVIVPVDNVAWLPPGLMNQLDGWLEELGVPAVFPKPFCSLTETTINVGRRQKEYDVPLVSNFAGQFGRPILEVDLEEGDDRIANVTVLRDAPCGCAYHVAEGLEGVSVEEAEHAAGMLHHHYPCLGCMSVDPEYSDTLLHVSGHILRDEVDRGVKPFKKSPVYVRPSGRND